ncbi:MAG TPA: dihydrodipicolinate synthase family protein [Alphaproteobacteria bacterium]|nr:dihydrodipicolinate synthase family protein [Alphaproteobacteria bacterium]
MADAKTFRVSGYCPVTVTPFDDSGAFVPDAFAEILQWHITNGADGLVIGADNGEASLLTPEDRRRMADIAVREAGGKIPVVMGAIGSHAFTADETARMVQIAADAGVTAALVAPTPYVGQASDAEVIGRFKATYDAVNLPIIAYNNPRHFGVPIEGDRLESLMGEVDLIGIKQSSRHFLDISKSIDRFADRICIFMGCGYLMMPGLAMGAGGIMSTGIDLLRGDAARVTPLARAAWTEETRALHLKIGQAYTLLLETGTAPSALKAALNAIGLPAGVPRPPVHELRGAELAALLDGLRKLGLVP